jgi:hypothetical protein
MAKRIKKPGTKGTGKGKSNGNGNQGDDYDVGYGRPPVHTQFKKGQSGNPKGKPKGKKNVKTMIRDILFEPLPMQVNGKQMNLNGVEGSALRLRQAGLGGDFRSAVQVVQLGMSLDPDVGSDKPEVEAPLFDQKTFNTILREYLANNDDDEDRGKDSGIVDGEAA